MPEASVFTVHVSLLSSVSVTGSPEIGALVTVSVSTPETVVASE